MTKKSTPILSGFCGDEAFAYDCPARSTLFIALPPYRQRLASSEKIETKGSPLCFIRA
nr:hypothetical protein [uncultured bacterium]